VSKATSSRLSAADDRRASGIGSILPDPDQPAAIEAQLLCLGQQLLTKVGWQIALAGQNPEVVSARTDDQRPAVVAIIERSDVVAAIKGTKERDFQRAQRRFTDELGLADRFLPCPLSAL
jgi:hypothetical protein